MSAMQPKAKKSCFNTKGIQFLFLNDCWKLASQINCYKYKAVGGGPAGPAMARPLFWPKMVSAGPQLSIIRPKMCRLFFF